ncbi:MAG TPA: VOC family protein [Thermoplasmata archaeon]|jgi:predicted enzyme related to lactoylglutathione lyase
MEAPFGSLEYLYVGTKDVERDLAYYRDLLGAAVVWDLTGMGSRVAAVRLGRGPLILLADHRPAPSCMPLYQVEDVKGTAKELRKRGWKPDGRPFEIPPGPCYVFEDPSGNRYGIFENVRPKVFE